VEIKELVYEGAKPIFDPPKLKISIEELLLQIGGTLSEAIVVLKGGDGQAYYPSTVSLQNEKLRELGPKMINLLKDVDIEVKGLIYVHYDEYLAEEYATVETSGKKSEGFICPLNERYEEQFLKTLKEISQINIENLIFALTGYASISYCFCEKCKTTFAMDKKMPKDFNLSTLQGEKELYHEWIEWRSKNIESFLSKTVEKTKELNINSLFAIEFDPILRYEEGLKEYLGIDVKNIAKFFNHFIIAVNPWEVLLPRMGSKSFNELVQKIKKLKRELNKKLSLMYWPPNEEELKTLLQLKEETKSENLYVFLQYPDQFKNWREVRTIT